MAGRAPVRRAGALAGPFSASLLALALALPPLPGAAQTLRRDQGPAERPPASYAGTQYVDSRGCVYIRAGIDDTVTWVPRVTRDREVVCGFTPTRTDGAASAASDTPRGSGDGAAPVTITAAAPEDAPQDASGDAADTGPAAPSPSAASADGTPRPGPRAPAAAASAPPPPVPAPSRPAGTPLATTPTAARGAAPGPAAGAPRLTPGPSDRDATLSRHPQAIPEGYMPVFDDGRLNARRAGQDGAGRAAMNRIWTETVPRRLVEAPGPAAPASAPAAPRRMAAATAPADPGTAPAGGTSTAPGLVSPPRASVSPTAAAGPARAAPYRFVQVATFGEPSNAAATSERMARRGLPVRVTRRGRYEVVVLGPFETEADMAHGLAAARSAGFDDAFPRN